MSIQTVTDNQRRRRLAAATTTVIHSTLPDQSTDEVLDRFNRAADEFMTAMANGWPALQESLRRELAGLDRNIKIQGAGEPPSLSINTGSFKLPDDSPPPQPLPDSRFSLPTDSPRAPDPEPGPFKLPEGD